MKITPGSSGFRCYSEPAREGRNDATRTPRDRFRSGSPRRPERGVFRHLPVAVRAAEAPGGTAGMDPGRLPRMPLRCFHGGAQGLRLLPALHGVRPESRLVQPAGAEPLPVVPRRLVLPGMPRPERGAEAQHPRGGPPRPGAAAPGRLHRIAPAGREDGPRVLLPLPRQQERRQVPGLPPVGSGRAGILLRTSNGEETMTGTRKSGRALFWAYLLLLGMLAATGCS